MFCLLHTICYMKTTNSDVDGRIRGRQIDIVFNNLPSDKPQEIKLHNVATTAKITFVASYCTFIRLNNIRFD